MITIDLLNGELKYQEYFFLPNTKLNNFKGNFLTTEMEPWTSNENWKSYRLNISEDFIFILYFQDQALKVIDIFPIEKNSGNEILLLLEKLGGEHNYSWGKVELNNDIKAGYKSVIIRYN